MERDDAASRITQYVVDPAWIRVWVVVRPSSGYIHRHILSRLLWPMLRERQGQ
jgi:uncharacterized membrane protein